MNGSGKAVFLSYASQDAAAARRLCEALRAAGIEVWFDQNELVGGDAWDQKIRGQIAACALFVPVISAHTQTRLEGYFRVEWKLAAQRTHAMADEKVFLLPVVIDDTRDAEAKVPGEFKTVQWTRLPGGETPEKFCARVKTLLTGVIAEPARASRAGFSPSAPASRRRRRLWPVASLATALVLIAGGTLWHKNQPATSHEPRPAARSPGPASPVERVAAILRKTDISRTELELASNLLAQATAANGADADAYAQWALVDSRFLGEYYDRSPARREAMREHAAKAHTLAPTLPLVRLVRAVTMRRLADNSATRAEASALLQPLLTELPDDPRVPLELAGIAARAGRIDEAREWYARAARLPGGAGPAHYERSFTELRNRGYARMQSAIESALTHERATKYLLWKAYLQVVWNGDPAAARRTLTEVPADAFVEDMPASARTFVAYWSRDYEGMLTAMQAVPREFMESMALDTPPGYNRGLAQARLGRRAAAEAEWRAALAAVERRLGEKSRDPSLLLSQAALLAQLGDRPAAEKVRTTAHELAGEDLSNWLEEDLAVLVLTPDRAIDRLEAQMQGNRGWLTAAVLRLAPHLDPLRTHPRFAALQAKADADPRLSPTAADAASAPQYPAR